MSETRLPERLEPRAVLAAASLGELLAGMPVGSPLASGSASVDGITAQAAAVSARSTASGVVGTRSVRVPAAPTGLSAAVGDNTRPAVYLSWNPAAANGSRVTDYVISYRSPGTPWRTYGDGVSALPFTTVFGLEYGKQYWFRVSAVNARGVGSPSTVAFQTFKIPGRPANVAAAAADGKVTLSWSPPAAPGVGFGPARDFVVSYWEATSNFPTTVTTTARSLTIDGLRNDVQYGFRVAARVWANGRFVEGFSSGAVNATPRATGGTPGVPGVTPGVPTNVAAVATDGGVNLTWSPPSGTGAAIAGYRVQVATSASFGNPTTYTSSTPSFTLGSLTNGLPYFFRVAAFNAQGTGGYSGGVSATPTKPSQPPPPPPPPPVSDFFWVGTRKLICDQGLSTQSQITVTLNSDGSGTITATGYYSGSGTFYSWEATKQEDYYGATAYGTFQRTGFFPAENPTFTMHPNPLRGAFGGLTYGY